MFSMTKKVKMKNYIALLVVNIENFKILILEKTLVLSIVWSKLKIWLKKT